MSRRSSRFSQEHQNEKEIRERQRHEESIAYAKRQTDASERSLAFTKRSYVIGAAALLVAVIAIVMQFIASVEPMKTFALTVKTDKPEQAGIAFVPLFGEPGGAPLVVETGPLGKNGLFSGQTYDIFECSVTLPDGSQWLRYHRKQSADGTFWAPRTLLKTPFEPVFKLSTFMADSQVPDPPGS